MKIIAINGSPRKNWNTATLLQKTLDGAVSAGAQTELINLYDLNYRGCYSCFACKELNGKSYGKCPIKDDLLPIFKKIENADALVLGSPIYLGRITGEMQSFFERLTFQYLTYTNPPGSLFPKKISTAFIYTMGQSEDAAKQMDYEVLFNSLERFLTIVFGASEKLFSFDAYQFEDYSKYYAPKFDVAAKKKHRTEVFPLDCQKAYEMGKRLILSKLV